jgi:adenosylcobinamide-phosphate synthase
MLPWYAQGGPVHPLAILLIALIADMAIGDPPLLWRAIPHPVAIIGGLGSWLERKLNRERRGQRDRLFRGALVAAGMTIAAVALGVAITELRRRWIWGWAVEAALVWMLLAQQSLFFHVRRVAKALTRDGVAGGRREVARIVGRDPASLDEYGVARAAIESCAESFADGVVGPVFWYVLFGMPGLLALKTVNTLDSMIGHRTPRFLMFGMVAARLDDAMMLVPARLAALLLVIAAIFVPRGKPRLAWRTMWKDHGRHASPNSGWPEAAMAGALDLALAGPRRYGGELVDTGWIGAGRARATPGDIHTSLYMLIVACLLNAGIVIALIRLEM